jgi:uncharacterized membrane protein
MSPSSQADRGESIPKLAADIRRILVAGLIGAAVALAGALVFAVVAVPGQFADVIIVGAFVFSAASSVAYVVLTFSLFQNAAPKSLASWLSSTAPRGRVSRFGAEIAGTGPTIAVQWSIIAIASVVALTLSPELLDNPWVIGLAALVVASSWLVTVVAYAVHYARVTATAGGLEFPGKDGTVFWDCVYLALQVQTTFGASDVTLSTTLARRIVTGQTLVAFAFNTVIIALLISVIFLRHS